MDGPAYMTVRETMDYLRVSRDTVERMIRRGKLRYQRMLDDMRNPIRINRADVLRVLPPPSSHE